MFLLVLLLEDNVHSCPKTVYIEKRLTLRVLRHAWGGYAHTKAR